jgi:hypothetical protein
MMVWSDLYCLSSGLANNMGRDLVLEMFLIDERNDQKLLYYSTLI